VKKVFLSLSLVLLFTQIAEAQFALNPVRLQFVASSDHDIQINGQPAVTRYEVEFYLEGASAPMNTIDLGKPMLGSNRTIVIDDTNLFMPLPLGNYVARVAAVGPAGRTLSEPSNPFGRLLPPSAATNVVVSQ